MSNKGKTLLKGHTLRREGMPFDGNGRECWSNRVNGTYWGRGKCSCGALSDVLPNVADRKRWHRAHKDEIRQSGGTT